MQLIKQKRLEMKISQGQLGAKLGYTAQFVTNWETGKSFPPKKIIKKLAQVLNIDKRLLLNEIIETKTKRIIENYNL